MQDFTSNIIWTCPECGGNNRQEISVPELNFAAEKMSDMGTDDFVEISCDHCGTAYSGHVWVYSDSTELEIEEPHEFTISGDMPMYGPPDDWDYEPPDDPHSIAKEALAQLEAMVGTPGPENDEQFTNRLVFSGAVSSFEAYLGDTLINAVTDEPTVRGNILGNNSQLGGVKVTAAEIAADPEVLNKKVIRELRDILYHNLKVVIVLYRDAFGMHLIPEEEKRDLLFKAMENRHHCVHRNGRDKEGEKLTVFTDDYVREVIAAINGVVDHVERERTKDLPF